MTNNAAPAEDAAVPRDGLPALLAPLGLAPEDLSPDPAEESEEPQDTRPPVLSRPVTPDDLAPGDPGTGDDPGIAAAMPTPPRHVVEAAEEAPGHWFALSDPAWTGGWPPPEWTVVGEWRADDLGQLVEWRHNPDYVRSPAARGWPRPTDAVDAAVQRAAAGYGQDDEVPELLAGAEVAVFVTPGGEPVAAIAPDGTPVVLAFTSEAHLSNAGRLTYEIHDVPALADRLPEGHQIYLNASASVSMCVEPAALARAIERARQEADAPGTGEEEPAYKPDGRPDAVPEGRLDAVPEGRLDAVPEGRLDAVPEGRLDALPDGRLDAVPDGRLDAVPDEGLEIEPDERPETEPEEVIAVATRVDTSGSTPASGPDPASSAAAPDTGTRSGETPEPSDTPAPAPAPVAAPVTATLAESAAAALMSTADR
ncbi:type VII secretion system-associated protein [Streptomyces sp. NPDC060002]|uniref:type VII secretion system-associated protein n=1 Tax=Streptomyces sp. NPDC060002 TaxID=3347033 RepID=UPI0036A5DAEA